MKKSSVASSGALVSSSGDGPHTLRLPKSLKTPVLELTEWGGRLPEQAYFPVYLGNGRDAMFINIMGSGENHWERSVRASSPLTRLLSTEWHKADRRDYGKSRLVYGQLMPFVNFSSGPVLRGDDVVPRDVRQYFDPRSATVTTFLTQIDNRTGEDLELRSQTFLTADGLLVQVIRCIKAPACGVQYFFSLGEPGPDYQNAKVPFVKPEDATFEGEGALLQYRSRWQQGRAEGFSLVGGVEVERIQVQSIDFPKFTQKDQVTVEFGSGDVVWRVLSIQDDREGGDPEAQCRALRERVNTLDVDGLHAAHCAQWEDYFSTSMVRFPDPAAQFLYDVSRYNIKANLHPCGFLPMGTMPYLWQGAMFWDASFGHQALLGCGNFQEAESVTGHIRSLESHGEKLAESLGSPGIRIEWTVNLFDFSVYDPPILQIHNNAVWAHALFEEARSQGRPICKEAAHFVRGLLAFLVDRLLHHAEETGSGAIIGMDESTRDPKPNDTWSAAICLKALEEYDAYCQERGLDPEIAELDRARTALRDILTSNTDADSVLQSFTGGRVPHWGSLVFDLFPDHLTAGPTLAKMTENYNAPHDLFNFHGLNRYAERAFPWANNWVARCLGRMRRPEALHYWLNNTRSTNHFGGVPERVWYHGENYINWCMTGHASQVWAMNGMLADFRDGVLTVLGGVDPAIWNSLAFSGIQAGDGLDVSLILEHGKIVELTVSSRSPRTLIIQAPHFDFNGSFHLQTGINPILGH